MVNNEMLNLEDAMNVLGYEDLARILGEAYNQAARGKGSERHGSTKAVQGLPWGDQPIMTINRQLGSIDGALYQVIKKATEVQNLPTLEAKVKELYGSIVYAAAAIKLLEEGATEPPLKVLGMDCRIVDSPNAISSYAALSLARHHGATAVDISYNLARELKECAPNGL